MKTSLTILAALALAMCPVLHAQDDGILIPEGGNSRIVRNADGSQSRYHKNAGQKGMTRATYDPSGRLTSIIVYHTGKWGQLTSCLVYDGSKNLLYKVAYGYDKQARLREEHMYDAKKIDPKTKENLLVRRFIYTYDEMGNRGKPVSIVFVEGVMVDKNTFSKEAAGDNINSTVPDVDVFDDVKTK